MQANKLTIQSDGCKASFSSVARCCGSIRVEGWIHAPNRTSGFAFSGRIGKALALKGTDTPDSLGGFCLNEEDTLFPFSFDVRPWYFRYATETLDETQARILKAIRRVKYTINRKA